jgi:hypothetical protein
MPQKSEIKGLFFFFHMCMHIGRMDVHMQVVVCACSCRGQRLTSDIFLSSFPLYRGRVFHCTQFANSAHLASQLALGIQSPPIKLRGYTQLSVFAGHLNSGSYIRGKGFILGVISSPPHPKAVLYVDPQCGRRHSEDPVKLLRVLLDSPSYWGIMYK